MFTLSQHHLTAFKQQREQQLSATFHARCQQYFPHYYQLAGQSAFQELFAKSMPLLDQYTIDMEPAVLSFIDHRILLGHGCHVDPMYKWVVAILEDPSYSDDILRLDTVHAYTKKYIAAVHGNDNQYWLAALQRTIECHLSSDNINGFARAKQWLSTIFPEKYDFLGELVITKLFQHVTEARRDQAELNELSPQTHSLLAYLLGCNFHSDPIIQGAFKNIILAAEEPLTIIEAYRQLILNLIDQLALIQQPKRISS